MSQAEKIDAGIRALGLGLPSGAPEKLLAYLGLLSKWNRTYNLTAVRDEADMVTHHLLDSLVVVPYLEGIARLADVGSGAGLPGLMLAVARPDLQVVSVEASQKKASFQQQAKIELGLGNVSIYCGRVEAMEPSEQFDAVISRAFSSLADFVRLTDRLVGREGRLLAMKGTVPADELAALPGGWRATATHKLAVPGLEAQRHLIVLGRD
jgi:16S rRNA (guanine527-N7)-methyltransferase